jgi:hypothetical protein
MNSGIDDFLDHVDAWKLELHRKLSRMSASQRKAFWNRMHKEARARGLPVVEAEKPAKRKMKGAR